MNDGSFNHQSVDDRAQQVSVNCYASRNLRSITDLRISSYHPQCASEPPTLTVEYATPSGSARFFGKLDWFVPRPVTLGAPPTGGNVETLLDAGLEAWRNRNLDETPYLLLDAHCERVFEAGQWVECTVLVAVGITVSGHRSVLGVSVARSNVPAHWPEFLHSLIKRGLRGVRMIASDDHVGFKAARETLFAGVSWQRCQSQLQLGAQALVLKPEQQVSVACTIRAIFNAPDEREARRLLRLALQTWHSDHPALSHWAEANLPEGFTVLGLPPQHRVRLRTLKALESLRKAIKRRTGVATELVNMHSCLRLVSAILVEQDEAWRSAKTYLNMKP